MTKRLTTEEFIEKAKLVHDNPYDYSLVNYIDWKTNVDIIDEYGFIHKIRPNNFLNGNKLNLQSVVNKTEYIINKFFNINGYRFNYDLVEYKHHKEKVIIICDKHGPFTQTIDNHLKGKGCPKCNGKNKNTMDIIDDFKLTHGNTYDYSLVNYLGIKNKVTIICKTHGPFKQTPEEHIKGCGCPICKESSGERKIRLFLDDNKIKFIQQHSFPNCKHINVLSFDFYLPDYNMCIEFNGKQHYEPINYFGGEKKFSLCIKRDMIKQSYCINNHIKLQIIKYDEDIHERLLDIFHELFNLI